MKAQIFLIFLLAFILLTACEKSKVFQNPPKELETPVKEFFIFHSERRKVIRFQSQTILGRYLFDKAFDR
jgi:hypothetical protein